MNETELSRVKEFRQLKKEIRKRIIVCVSQKKGVPPRLGKEERKEIPHETNDNQEFATGV